MLYIYVIFIYFIYFMILVFFISELYSYIYIYQPSRYMLAMFSLVHDNEHKHNNLQISNHKG